MNVAVTRVHVQSDPYATLQHALMDGVEFSPYGGKRISREYFGERVSQLAFPGDAEGSILQRRENRPSVEGRVEVVQELLPPRSYFDDEFPGAQRAVCENLGSGQRIELCITGFTRT
jgi:hypothetical protein